MYSRVKNWMEECGFYVGEEPHAPPMEVFRARYDLIEEEATETLESLKNIRIAFLKFGEPSDKEIVHFMKELADLIIVCMGAFVNMGIPVDEVFEAVMKNNEYKLDYMDGTKNGKPKLPPEIKKMLHKEVDFELKKLLQKTP